MLNAGVSPVTEPGTAYGARNWGVAKDEHSEFFDLGSGYTFASLDILCGLSLNTAATSQLHESFFFPNLRKQVTS